MVCARKSGGALPLRNPRAKAVMKPKRYKTIYPLGAMLATGAMTSSIALSFGAFFGTSLLVDYVQEETPNAIEKRSRTMKHRERGDISNYKPVTYVTRSG
jgi:hypothetical protein